MKNTIEETTRLLLQGTLTKDEADKILLSLSNVSGQCEHPYDSILKGNDIRPTQCLKCGKALSEH